MIYLLALLLGLVQGVAEFLPISSSGHLTLAAEWLQRMFGQHVEVLQGKEFSVAVHVGTLGSIVIVYFRRLLAATTDLPLMTKIVLATIPVAATGLLLEDTIEGLMHSPRAVGVALLVTGGLLAAIRPIERWHAARKDATNELAAADPSPGEHADSPVVLPHPQAVASTEPPPETAVADDPSTTSDAPDDLASDATTDAGHVPPAGRTLETMTYLDALIVGLVQSVAIVPGISRSGSTIFAGVLAGMDRRAAADFSFFIAIPAIAGAAVLSLKDIIEAQQSEVPADVLAWGTMVALVTGLISLKVLLAIVARGELVWFAVYCWLVGFAAIAIV